MSLPDLEVIPKVPIPDFLLGEVQSRLAYVDEAVSSVRVAESGDRIYLSMWREMDAAERSQIEDKLQRVVTAMVEGAIRPRTQVLEDNLDRPVPNHRDPMPQLTADGEVSKEATGVFTFGPQLTRLIGYFESRLAELAARFDAQPYRFPTLISAEFLDRVKYFRAFPHTLTFATHLRSDLDVIDAFAAQAAYQKTGLNTNPESLAPIKTLLSPAVCYHLYFALADREVAGGQLVATAVGNCFRYESSNLISLERLWNFTMQEIIFVGDKEFVLSKRDEARAIVGDLLNEWGIAYRVESANDPFFIGEFRAQAAFQSAFELKYEVRARVPHRDGTLAIGSYNYHQDFFGRHLDMQIPGGAAAHTGCVAFGLERLAYAFLSQYGVQPSGWPAHIRESIS